MNYLRPLLSIVALFSLLSLGNGQNEFGFQRLYSSDNNQIINLASAPTLDGGYYLASVSIDSAFVNRINITSHDIKGDIISSSEYEVLNTSYAIDSKSFSLQVVEDNMLFITALAFDPLSGLRDDKVMIKLGTDEEVVWSMVIEDEINSVGNIITFPVTTFSAQEINVFTTHLNDISYGIHHNRFDSDNNTVLSQTYIPTDTLGNRMLGALVDVTSLADLSHSVAFIADSTSLIGGLLKIDSLGAPQTALGYSVNQTRFPNTIFQLSSIAAVTDTTEVMSGLILNILSGEINNVIVKTDISGNVIWSKIIDTSTSGFIAQVNDVITTSSNEIAVTGKYLNFNAGLNVGDFTIFFDLEGNVIRQVDHNSDNSFFTDGNIALPIGELNNSSDGNTFYSTTGIDLNGGTLGNYMIKMDSIGNAMCSDTFTIGNMIDINLIIDTLNIELGNFGFLDSLNVERTSFNGFNTPILSLSDTIFCPQDPILYEIIGTVPGATDYIWSTGDTTDRITVMEEGEFSVTVTIGERVCYSLCDTTNVSQLDFPEAQISNDPSFFCEDGFVRLSGILTAGAGAREYLWDDNTVERTRDVTGPGNYSVTITDNCDNTATANINLDDSVFSIDVLSSISQGAFDCDNGVQLSVTSISPFPVQSILWSTGESTETIGALNSGDYSVTVTNICGAIDQDSISVSIADFSDLVYPNVFFPTSDIDVNRTFGPYIECPELFVGNEYSLEIFNRWGDKVYESDRVVDRWNGRINNMGDIIQEDVYLYVYSYFDEAGVEIKGNGSVTLSRQ